MAMDEDLPFFEAKLDKMKSYLEALKVAAAEEVHPTRIAWFNSVIEHVADMINVFILCKSKLETRLEKKKLAYRLAAITTTTSCSQVASKSALPLVSHDRGNTTSASNVVLSDSAVSTYKPIRSDGSLLSCNNTSSSTNALSSSYGSPPASQVISKPLVSRDLPRDNTSASSNGLSSDAAASTSYMPLREDGSSLQHLSRSNSSTNVHSSDYGTSTSATAPVNESLLSSWAVENKESIVFMNIPESTVFEPKQKSNSDLGDVLKILECIGASATVQNVCRFSPKSLPVDRPPFLKTRFSTVKEKKQVFACVKANHSRIRALGDKFSEFGFCDPDKSGKATNSYRNNDNPGASSFKSRSQGASPPPGSRADTTTTVSKFGSARFLANGLQQPQSSNGLAVSQAKSRFGSFSPPSTPPDASTSCRSATDSCPPSSSIAYPSAFGGNRDRFSTNPNTTPLGTSRVYQPLQPATSVEDVRRPQICNRQAKSPQFSARPRSKSVQAPRPNQPSHTGYTRGHPGGIYTSDEDN